MNLFTHALAERLINALMPAHAAQALELGSNDGGKEMPPVALDFTVVAGQPGGDELLNFSWSRVGHSDRF